jgi:hypothetical protein
VPPLGRYHEAAGRRLLLHRSGSGSPAAVFLPGGGAVGLDYLNVQQQAAGLTTSVVYDRAGTGWSDQAGLPRTSAQVTDELRELLHAAGVPAPYLLAGHSLRRPVRAALCAALPGRGGRPAPAGPGT